MERKETPKLVSQEVLPKIAVTDRLVENPSDFNEDLKIISGTGLTLEVAAADDEVNQLSKKGQRSDVFVGDEILVGNRNDSTVGLIELKLTHFKQEKGEGRFKKRLNSAGGNTLKNRIGPSTHSSFSVNKPLQKL